MPRLSTHLSCRPQTRSVRLDVVQLESRDLWSANAIGQAFVQAIPNDPSFGQLYGMQKIQAPSAWDITKGSTSVVVADIDSGIDYTHRDLYKNVWINQGEVPQEVKDAIGSPVNFYNLNNAFLNDPVTHSGWDTDLNGSIDGKDVLALWSNGDDADGNGYTDDLIGWNFVNNSNDPFDDNGHGTHTAGTIGAMGNNALGVVGVNWEVQIMALKFIAGDGSGSLEWAANAIRYAVDNGASVSNNSWGYYGGSTGDTIYQAIDYARTHNHLVIAAAGNDGFNNDKSIWRTYPASFSLSNIISVAATDSKDAKPRWSNYGKTTVDLGAPGVNVLSTLPGDQYGYGSGTSMATPHVTGTIGLILASRPDLANSPDTIKALILGNVDKVKSLDGKTVTGGRLNAFKALSDAQDGLASGAGFSGSGSDDSTGSPGGGSGRGQALGLSPTDLHAQEVAWESPSSDLWTSTALTFGGEGITQTEESENLISDTMTLDGLEVSGPEVFVAKIESNGEFTPFDTDLAELQELSFDGVNGPTVVDR